MLIAEYQGEPFMRIRRSLTVLACSGLVAITPVLAATQKEAADFAERGDFAAAARVYDTLVAKDPKSVALRLALADALAKDRQWDRAATEYEKAVQLNPRNVEALRGLGTVRRWQGHLPEARQAYEKARTVAPSDSETHLGLAATYRLDHDFAAAQRLYDDAQTRWPRDTDVQQTAYDFARERRPRVNIFYEDDLSFETRQLGLAVPFAGREEFGVEHQTEKRVQYQTGTETYTRTDNKLLYTHFFGLNHALDASARQAAYDYAQPITGTGFTTAIDSFSEYRVRYTVPVTPEQIVAVRYSARPTKLMITGDSFTAHKLEGEITSQWTPRFQTLLGTGQLRDLDENATSKNDLVNNSLTKLGFQADLTNRFQVSAKYITNPDLDNTVKGTTLLQADYTFTGTISGLARHRADDYKQGDDQTSFYLGLRYVPNSHLWSEFGVKRVERGTENSIDPLVSVVYRF